MWQNTRESRAMRSTPCSEVGMDRPLDFQGPRTKDSVLLRQTSDGWEIRPDETLVGIQREGG